MSSGNAVIQVAESFRERLQWHHQGDSSRERLLLGEGRYKKGIRIAQELHDALLQGFRGACMQFCLADDWLGADSPAKLNLRRVLDLMRKGITEARATRRGPRSPVLADGSLEKALSDVRNDFGPSKSARFRIVIFGGGKPLEPAVQEQIYLIAREALLNAFEHSEASRTEVEIEYQRRKLRVVVRDNGKGIDPKVLQSGQNPHRGLKSMRESAASIGAEIRVWSNLGEGTEVEISVPIHGGRAPSRLT